MIIPQLQARPFEVKNEIGRSESNFESNRKVEKYKRLKMGRGDNKNIPDIEIERRQLVNGAGHTITTTNDDKDENNRATRTKTREEAETHGRTTSSVSEPTVARTTNRNSDHTTSSSLMALDTGKDRQGGVKGSSSFSAKSTIYVNSFPPDFPIQTPEPARTHPGTKGYLFVKDQQILDSTLIFAMIFSTFLILTITCIKCNSIFTKAKQERKGKIDNVIMDDMKWAEGREVIERKIVWERNSRIKSKNGQGARRSALGMGRGSGLRGQS